MASAPRRPSPPGSPASSGPGWESLLRDLQQEPDFPELLGKSEAAAKTSRDKQRGKFRRSDEDSIKAVAYNVETPEELKVFKARLKSDLAFNNKALQYQEFLQGELTSALRLYSRRNEGFRTAFIKDITDKAIGIVVLYRDGSRRLSELISEGSKTLFQEARPAPPSSGRPGTAAGPSQPTSSTPPARRDGSSSNRGGGRQGGRPSGDALAGRGAGEGSAGRGASRRRQAPNVPAAAAPAQAAIPPRTSGSSTGAAGADTAGSPHARTGGCMPLRCFRPSGSSRR